MYTVLTKDDRNFTNPILRLVLQLQPNAYWKSASDRLVEDICDGASGRMSSWPPIAGPLSLGPRFMLIELAIRCVKELL